jgi:tRNA(Ile)-lysidine synthase
MRFLMSILKKAKNKVTVALSAGSDSVAVSHFLKTRYPKIELQCFHFNHNLRTQNELMQSKAKEFCKDFGISLSIAKRLQRDDNSEAALRAERYKSMAGLGAVITGHHLSDAVESYLYNCFNGVPEYLPIPLETDYFDIGLKILRPFIISDKSEILSYIEENNLEKYVVDDETNTDEKYRRNWIRNNIIPQISDKGYNLKTVVKKRYLEYIKKGR